MSMKMKDWIEKLDGFLDFNEYETIKITHNNMRYLIYNKK